MRKRILPGIIACAFLAGISSTVFAATLTTLVDQGAEWNYQQFSSPDLWTNWSSADHSSFDWAGATWSTGNAAFGNTGAYTTFWTANTDLALQNTFNIAGTLSGPLTLNVASDNGFIIFINGTQVAKENAEGFTSYWEYTLPLDSYLGSFVSPGSNLIQVLAEDHGGATYFDMKLTGYVANTVPEPATIGMLASGLFGLAGYRWRQRRQAGLKIS